MRFQVSQFVDRGGIEYALIDSEVTYRNGRPVVARVYSSQAAATSAATTLNSTRGPAASELPALYPSPGAGTVTIGNTGGGSATITVGVVATPSDDTGPRLTLFSAAPLGVRFTIMNDPSRSGANWVVIDNDIYLTLTGQPFVARACATRGEAQAVATSWNEFRGEASSELPALYPAAGAAAVTIGNGALTTATVIVGVF